MFVAGTFYSTLFIGIGFMTFFIVFSANQKLYRDYSFLLTIFMSSFILGQYWLSLYYASYINEATDVDTCNIMPYENSDGSCIYGTTPSGCDINDSTTQNPCTCAQEIDEYCSFFRFMGWTLNMNLTFSDDTSDIYFRTEPCALYFFVLFLMVSINKVNYWFIDKAEVQQIEEACDLKITTRYKRSAKLYKIVTGVFKQVMIFLVLIFLVYDTLSQTASLIDWIYLIINCILFGLLASATHRSLGRKKNNDQDQE
jgi:predicted permease